MRRIDTLAHHALAVAATQKAQNAGPKTVRPIDTPRIGDYDDHMTMTIGSRELKTRLGTYLRQVREGTTILVTDRGRPVAELRPVPAASTDEEARLAELAAAGLVTPPTQKTWPARKPVRISGPPISDTVIEDREDRF